MKKILFLLLAAALMSACKNDEVKIAPGEVVITGETINLNEKSSRVVAVHFMNPLDDNSTKAAQMDSEGSFRIAYEMPYGQSVNIQYAGKFITLYAEPGDSVHVTIDASKMKSDDLREIIRYSGDKTQINNAFTPAYSLFTDEINRDESFYDRSLSPEAFFDAVQARLQTSRDSLAAYAQRENLADEVVRLVDNEILCSVVYYTGGYGHPEDGPVKARIFSAEVFDPFDSRISSSQMFFYCLNQYLAHKDFYAGRDRESVSETLRKFTEWAQENPKGLPRDLMLESVFAYMETGFPGISGEYPELHGLFASGYAWEQFQKGLRKEVPTFARTPMDGIERIGEAFEREPLPGIDVFEYLAGRYPDKAIYIDICAHWCGPCLAEIPHMKTLHEQFADKEVVFVVLWMSSKFNNCVELIRKHEMKEDHYFFSEDAYLLFRGTYGFSGFPTYMLMDRNGKLVHLNAGRPSGTETAEQIESLL